MSDFTVSFIPLDQVVESDCNPWHGREDVAELADSIRRHGVQQPILLRPRQDGMLELVFGHRRARAAHAAGLSEIPARIRELSDEAALEEQLTENSHRTDVHPIDEGELLQRLISRHGYTVEQCADRVRKSRAWVYERIRLAGVTDEVKAAAYAGDISTTVAGLIAALPKSRQFPATEAVRRRGAAPALTVEAARSVLDRAVPSSDLEEVRWALDEKLKDARGKLPTCKGCAFYRAAEQDGYRAARCLDTDCFDRKRDVTNARAVAGFLALGCQPATDERLLEVAPYGYVLGSTGCVMVDLDGSAADTVESAGLTPTDACLLEGDIAHEFTGAPGVAAALALTFVGIHPRTKDVVAFAPKAELTDALAAAGLGTVDEEDEGRDDSTGAADDEDDDLEYLDTDADEDDSAGRPQPAVSAPAPDWMSAIVAHAKDCPRDRPFWLALADLSIGKLWDLNDDACLDVAKEHGFEPSERDDETPAADDIAAWAADLPEPALAALVMHCVLWEFEDLNLETDAVERIARRFGIDTPKPVQTLDSEEAA